MVGFGPVLVNETPELLSQIDDFKDAASLVGDDDPRLFFLVDYDDTRQSRQHDGAQGCTRRQHGSFMGSLVGLLLISSLLKQSDVALRRLCFLRAIVRGKS